MTTGMVGYIAFGDKVKSALILNLPIQDPLSIAAKLFYIINICGSFVLVCNPIFTVIERTEAYMNLLKFDGIDG